MRFFDLHCDTLTKLLDNGKGENLFFNRLQVDTARARKVGVYFQNFAIFSKENATDEEKIRRFRAVTDNIERDFFLAGLIFARNRKNYEYAFENSLMCGLLSVEDCGFFASKSDFKDAFARGVRIVSLTWNHDNHFGGGALGSSALTEDGKSALSFIAESGMALDVSHLNEQTFKDVMRYAPDNLNIIATHSNAYAICANPRNLNDHQLALLNEHEALLGLCLYPPFVNGCQKAKYSDIINHAEHISRYFPNIKLAIGSDFDGAEGKTVGVGRVHSIQHIPRLYKAFMKLGWSGEECNAVFFDNAYEYFKNLLPE